MLLLDRGADIQARNIDGQTPCVLAESKDSLDGTGVYQRLCAEFELWHTVEFWTIRSVAEVYRAMDRGADIHAQYFSGDTPLHLAVSQNDNVAVAVLLLELGAEIEA